MNDITEDNTIIMFVRCEVLIFHWQGQLSTKTKNNLQNLIEIPL